MRSKVLITLSLVAIIVVGCSFRENPRQVNRISNDNDFVSTIAADKGKHAYVIEVRKTNPKAKKSIDPLAVQYGVILTRDDGLIISEKPGSQVMFKTIYEDGETNLAAKDSYLVRIQLSVDKLPSGNYVMEPAVKIRETGDEQVQGTVELKPDKTKGYIKLKI